MNVSNGACKHFPTSSRRSALTLSEVLVVITILAVVMAIVLPVVGSVKSSAKKAVCSSQLHQLGLALQMYANDHDGLLPKDRLESFTGEHLVWTTLKPYYKEVELVLCPSRKGTHSDTLGYQYRAAYRNSGEAGAGSLRTVLGTSSSSVIAYCFEHLDGKTFDYPVTFFEPTLGEDLRYSGQFPGMRLDTSAASFDAKQVEIWVSDSETWYPLGSEPDNLDVFIRVPRFPGEPWPPEFQP